MWLQKNTTPYTFLRYMDTKMIARTATASFRICALSRSEFRRFSWISAMIEITGSRLLLSGTHPLPDSNLNMRLLVYLIIILTGLRINEFQERSSHWKQTTDCGKFRCTLYHKHVLLFCFSHNHKTHHPAPGLRFYRACAHMCRPMILRLSVCATGTSSLLCTQACICSVAACDVWRQFRFCPK